MRIKSYICFAVAAVVAAGCDQPAGGTAAQAEEAGALSYETVFNADGVVWGFSFISDDELLATLRQGVLLYANLTTGESREVALGLDIAARGQGGLLDVRFYPHDGKDYVYLTYSTPVDDGVTALARGVWDGENLVDVETIFVADKMTGGSGRHFGSRLAFRGGHIYMTTGDRGERDYSQDLSSHNGKVLRLTMDGKPAAGNPYENDSDALPEIWSYGIRNSQGIGFDTAGDLYAVDFGPRGGDELNLIKPGANYGWPVITYGREYWGPSIGEKAHPDMEQPVIYWVPSISPSGMVFYTGDKIPQWTGDLFIANLSSQHLRRLVIENNKVVRQQELYADQDERIRHTNNAPDGYLYFSTDSGKIVRVSAAQ